MRFLDKHSGRDKRLLALERELNRLGKAQANAPIIPLERPYQRGWVKTYVLGDRIDQRPDAAVFRTILTHVNQRIYARHHSFTRPNGDEIVLRPRIIPTHEWMKLGWPMSHQRFFGYGSWRLEDEPWMPVRWRKHVSGFKLVRTAWLKEDIQPRLITHLRVDLPEVRSRIAEIEAFLTATCGRHRLDRLHGRRQWWCRLSRTLVERRSAEDFHDHLLNNTPD